MEGGIIMTREEEIRKAGIEYTMEHNPMCIGGGAFADIVEEMNRNYAFEAGAKWADKTMIDKACEWIEKNRNELSRVDTRGFVELLKKAMEE